MIWLVWVGVVVLGGVLAIWTEWRENEWRMKDMLEQQEALLMYDSVYEREKRERRTRKKLGSDRTRRMRRQRWNQKGWIGW